MLPRRILVSGRKIRPLHVREGSGGECQALGQPGLVPSCLPSDPCVVKTQGCHSEAPKALRNLYFVLAPYKVQTPRPSARADEG